MPGYEDDEFTDPIGEGQGQQQAAHEQNSKQLVRVEEAGKAPTEVASVPEKSVKDDGGMPLVYRKEKDAKAEAGDANQSVEATVPEKKAVLAENDDDVEDKNLFKPYQDYGHLKQSEEAQKQASQRFIKEKDAEAEAEDAEEDDSETRQKKADAKQGKYREEKQGNTLVAANTTVNSV